MNDFLPTAAIVTVSLPKNKLVISTELFYYFQSEHFIYDEGCPKDKKKINYDMNVNYVKLNHV